MSDVGILGYGLYLPEHTMSAADIAAATGGRWRRVALLLLAAWLGATLAWLLWRIFTGWSA